MVVVIRGTFDLGGGRYFLFAPFFPNLEGKFTVSYLVRLHYTILKSLMSTCRVLRWLSISHLINYPTPESSVSTPRQIIKSTMSEQIKRTNSLIMQGKLSIRPDIPPLTSRPHKNVIYLAWMNPRKLDGSHYSDIEVTKIMNNSGALFNTVKIGMSGDGIEGAIRKVKDRSTYTMFAAMEFIILDVPTDMALYFEQLSLTMCSTSTDRDFGEFRVCRKEVAKTWIITLNQRLNERVVSENNPNGMFLHPFKMWRGKLDSRVGASQLAEEKNKESSIYILTIDVGESLNLSESNIAQLESVPHFYTLLTMVHFGVTTQNVRKRLTQYLWYMPVPALKTRYVKVNNSMHIENCIKTHFSGNLQIVMGNSELNTREALSNVSILQLQNWIQEFIDSDSPQCKLPDDGSTFYELTLTRREDRSMLPIPSALIVVAASCGFTTIGEITSKIDNVNLTYPGDRAFWDNDNFKNASGTMQFRYISLKNHTKLELDCLQFFNRYFDLDGRVLNDEESNWVVLRTRYNNSTDGERIGLPYGDWSKQVVLLNHFL